MIGASQIQHGTAVAIDGEGILLLGRSGSGKSDLALRLIDRGAVLISDDAVAISLDDDGIKLGAAPNIVGKIEMRGVGIVERPFVPSAPLCLVVRLDENPERLPADHDSRVLHGFDIPALAVNAFEASVSLKVEQRLKTVIDAGLLPMAVESANP